MLREFAIIAIGGGEQADVPKRLIEIATVADGESPLSWRAFCDQS